MIAIRVPEQIQFLKSKYYWLGYTLIIIIIRLTIKVKLEFRSPNSPNWTVCSGRTKWSNTLIKNDHLTGEKLCSPNYEGALSFLTFFLDKVGETVSVSGHLIFSAGLWVPNQGACFYQIKYEFSYFHHASLHHADTIYTNRSHSDTPTIISCSQSCHWARNFF